MLLFSPIKNQSISFPCSYLVVVVFGTFTEWCSLNVYKIMIQRRFRMRTHIHKTAKITLQRSYMSKTYLRHQVQSLLLPSFYHWSRFLCRIQLPLHRLDCGIPLPGLLSVEERCYYSTICELKYILTSKDDQRDFILPRT